MFNTHKLQSTSGFDLQTNSLSVAVSLERKIIKFQNNYVRTVNENNFPEHRLSMRKKKL